MVPTPVVRVVSRTCPPGRLGRVRYAGRVDHGRGLPVPPMRRFDAFGLMYLWQGEGIYRTPERAIPLRTGDLVYVVPGMPHWYGVTEGRDWNEVFIVFEGPAFELAQRQGLIDADRPVRHVAPEQYWRSRIEAFRTGRVPRTSAGADSEVCQVLQLLVDIAGRDQLSTARAPAGWLAESQARLCASLSEPLELSTIADAVGLPYETWRRRFRDAVGVAPGRYRMQHRLDMARQLLRQTSLSVADIAANLGFTDEAHLARHFRRYVGMTAGQYRREGE